MQAAVLAQPLDEALALERHPENKVILSALTLTPTLKLLTPYP